MRKKHMIAAASAAVLLIASMILFLMFYGMQEDEPPIQQVVTEKFSAYETDLRDSLGSMNDNIDVGNYLLDWAKNKQIPAFADSAGNIIYNIPSADSDSQQTQPAAVICSYDAADMGSHIEEIAAALTIAKNTDSRRNLQIIFLAENQGDKVGAQVLDTSNFDENTAIFYLGATPSAHVSAATGGYQHIRITNKLHYTEPSYGKAYKISLKNCPSLSISGNYTPGLNPIKTLGSLLANFKSTSLLFELSEFQGGTDERITPSEASMTVIINESDAAKFQKKMDNSIEKFYEKYHADYPEIEYTYEEADLPSRVIKGNDTDNLVSLMYTAFNGIYTRDDEGTIVALTNIGRLSTGGGRMKIDTAVMCFDQEIMDEISETYETICGLCDMKFKVAENIPIYNGTENASANELLTAFRSAYKDFAGKNIPEEHTAALTACSYIHQKSPDFPMIFCGITEKSKYNMAGSIMIWLEQDLQ